MTVTFNQSNNNNTYGNGTQNISQNIYNNFNSLSEDRKIQKLLEELKLYKDSLPEEAVTDVEELVHVLESTPKSDWTKPNIVSKLSQIFGRVSVILAGSASVLGDVEKIVSIVTQLSESIGGLWK